MRLFLLLLFSCLCFGCQSENRDNSRAYVEGTISKTHLNYNEIYVMIKNGNTIVAEVIPNNSGEFTISGPLLSESFSLLFTSKVKSFKASKPGCAISDDSLQIIVPPGITFITFNQIELE